MSSREQAADESFRVYAVRCGDGATDRHRLEHRTVRRLALMKMSSLQRSTACTCGPHDLVTAVVSRSPWVPVGGPVDEVDPDLTTQLREGPLAHACPRCGAGVGKPCENLLARRKGEVVANHWPHSLRIEIWNETP